MINRFEEILKELGEELGIALHADRIGACSLRINEHHVRLEVDSHQENLLIATFICEIPPGKFRENILKDALKSNSPFPSCGTLSYSDKNNMLALFAYKRLADLSGHKLAEFLLSFIDRAKSWRTGVETGNTSQLAGSGVKI